MNKKLKGSKPKNYEYFIVIGLFLFVSGSLSQIFVSFSEDKLFYLNMNLYLFYTIDWLSGSFIPLGIMIILSGLYFGIFDVYEVLRSSTYKKIQNILTESTDLGDRPEAKEKQILLLNEYYKQGLYEAYISFGFSILSATAGIMIIFISLIKLGFTNEASSQELNVAQLVCGTIISAVSGLFFGLSNRAKKVMLDFSEKLRLDRKMNNSEKLIEQIQDPIMKDKMRSLIALRFAEVEVDNIQLVKILSGKDTADDI